MKRFLLLLFSTLLLFSCDKDEEFDYLEGTKWESTEEVEPGIINSNLLHFFSDTEFYSINEVIVEGKGVIMSNKHRGIYVYNPPYVVMNSDGVSVKAKVQNMRMTKTEGFRTVWIKRW